MKDLGGDFLLDSKLDQILSSQFTNPDQTDYATPFATPTSLHPFLSSRDSKISLLEHEILIMKEDIASGNSIPTKDTLKEISVEDEEVSVDLMSESLKELDTLVCNYLESRSNLKLSYLQLKEDLNAATPIHKKLSKSLVEIYGREKEDEDLEVRYNKKIEEVEEGKKRGEVFREENERLKCEIEGLKSMNEKQKIQLTQLKNQIEDIKREKLESEQFKEGDERHPLSNQIELVLGEGLPKLCSLVPGHSR